MKIKFKHPDPRAGTVAQMDSIRGRELVDSGAADEVKDDGGRVAVSRRSAAANPTAAAGKRSSASPAAPASRKTTVKPSGRGAKKARRGA